MLYKNRNFTGIVVIALMLIFCNEANSQSGWYQLPSGTNNVLNSTFFTSALTGYMVGTNIAIKTSNGGYNWQVMPNLNGGTCVYFVNDFTGYVSNGTIYKTTDGGTSWVDLNVMYIKSLYFIDSQTGYGAGSYNDIIRTTNGGGSWTRVSPFISNYYLKSVYFTSAQTGYAVGGIYNIPPGALIYKTTDSGLNWVKNNLEADDVEFRSVFFSSADTGYIVGGQVSGASGVIYKTFDAGTTWIQQGVTNKSLNSVFFVNPMIGYAVGQGGMVLKTVDGSVIWNSQLSNTQKDINSVYFVAENVGFTAGIAGTIQKTVNGGVLGPPYAISGFIHYEGDTTHHPIKGKVYAVRYDTTTGSIIYLDTAHILNGVYQFTHVPPGGTDIMAYQDDEENDNPPILDFVPTFYGNTIFWANATVINITHNLTDINISVPKIVNPGGNFGIIGGGVFAQNNNFPLPGARVYAQVGSNYVNFGSSVINGAYNIKYLPQGNYHLICDRFGYRSAARNVVLGTVNLDTINFYLATTGPIGIQNQGVGIPAAYKLGQNYPNPFNPSTNIRIDIPQLGEHSSQSVRLIIYDMLGREVAVLINQQLKPGTYKVDWNAGNLPSGLYFYKLVVSEANISNSTGFTDTKKMILLK